MSQMSLLAVTGPPGAGKSPVALILALSTGRSVLVSGDSFFGFLARGAIEPVASWLTLSAGTGPIARRPCRRPISRPLIE